jgi:ferredoxin-NADP reductase
MSKYTIKLIKKEMIANETMAFHFEKPANFKYLAGQYADFTLINPPETDAEGDKRTFSLASAPCEPDLMIATRLRNTAFKRTLKDLPEDDSELQLDGPYGSFTLPKTSDKPAVFITGGIGATFARSMILQATHDSMPQKMIFLYSSSSPQDSPFLDQFTALSEQNKHFTFVPTMTNLKDHSWSGEQGYITIDTVKKYVNDSNTPIYYLSGPGAMMVAMRKMLLEAGVNRFNIRSDQFIGY